MVKDKRGEEWFPAGAETLVLQMNVVADARTVILLPMKLNYWYQQAESLFWFFFFLFI